MSRNEWTDEEIEVLKEFYPKAPNEAVAEMVNHSKGTVQNKAYKLGLKTDRRLSCVHYIREGEEEIEHPNPDTDFAHWLCGFVDGEGSFHVTRSGNTPQFRFTIGLAESDKRMLEEIKEYFECGSIYHTEKDKDNWEDNEIYVVTSPTDIARTIIPFFDRAKLRADNKKEQYIQWRNEFVEDYELAERLNTYRQQQ